MPGDQFSSNTKDIIRKRASFICSNPECRALTLCPSNAEESKSIYIGIAAHITAASEGGPRYYPALSSEQRSSAENGIFLCSSCSDMVDANKGVDFPVELLQSWKEEHHKWVSSNLNKRVSLISGDVGFPNLDLVFQDGSTNAILARDAENLSEDDSWKSDLARLVVCIELALRNSGAISANDIDGWIDIPEGTSLFDKDSMEQYWKIYPLDPLEDFEEFGDLLLHKDRRPAIERITESMSDSLLFGVFESEVRVPIGTLISQPMTKRIKPNLLRDQITFNLRKLKHNSTIFFDQIFLLLPDETIGKSIELEFRINAEGLPADLTGALVLAT